MLVPNDPDWNERFKKTDRSLLRPSANPKSKVSRIADYGTVERLSTRLGCEAMISSATARTRAVWAPGQ